jgi:UDP-2-acetamido-3-amino-2,3-dideoxy-glucuronate N-acetyltransferase
VTNRPGPTLAQPAAVPAVAVIGCGQWGKNLARCFAELGSLRAVADPNEGSAREIAATYNSEARSFEAVLGDAAIDAVAIAAPAALHYELAIAALNAGKHVYVEKPLSLDLSDAQHLCATADALDRVLMVGHLLQYHPAFIALREQVRAGALGRINYLYSNRLSFGRIRREESIFWSFASHDISMILSLVGSEPEHVSAIGSYYLHRRIADVTMTHLVFPGGEEGHVFVSWLHPYKEQKLVVIGELGMAVFDDERPWDEKLQLYRHTVTWEGGLPTPHPADAEPAPLEAQEPLEEECRHFLQCVATGATPRTDGAEGLRVLRVLQAADRALRVPAADSLAESHQLTGAPTVHGTYLHDSACVDEGVSVGEGTKIWHFSHLLAGARVGRDCTIGQNVMIGRSVQIGDRCKIQNNVSVYEGVQLEDGVFCGPSCVFTNVTNPRAEIERKNEFQPTIVRRGATIGANATIVCGNELGEYCFIGAGSVVTGDVTPHALMVGVPARRVGWMSRLGERLGDDLTCPRSGEQYEIDADGGLTRRESG